MKRDAGLSLVELLVALAILGTVFMVLANSQIANLRTTARSQASTQARALALRELETLSSRVLQVTPAAPTIYGKYAFARYYDFCRTTPLPVPAGVAPVACRSEAGAAVAWEIVSEADLSADPAERVKGEGQVRLNLTVVDARGVPFSVVERVSCYDVYPSPTSTAPAPCPEPVGGVP